MIHKILDKLGAKRIDFTLGLDAEGAYKIYDKKGRQATRYVGGDTGCDLNRILFLNSYAYSLSLFIFRNL